MLTLAEIRSGLTGAWLMFRNDPDAMDHFDLSFEGFWKSFLAGILLIPVVLVQVQTEWALRLRMGETMDFSLSGYRLVGLLTLLIGWFGYPLIVLVLARLLGFSDRVVAFIIAQNWCAILASIAVSLPFLAAGIGLIGPFGLSLIIIVLLVILLRYFYVVARISMEASPAIAAVLSGLNLIFGLIASEIAVSMV